MFSAYNVFKYVYIILLFQYGMGNLRLKECVGIFTNKKQPIILNNMTTICVGYINTNKLGKIKIQRTDFLINKFLTTGFRHFITKDVHCWTKPHLSVTIATRSVLRGASLIQRVPLILPSHSAHFITDLHTLRLPVRGRHSRTVRPHQSFALQAMFFFFFFWG